MRVGGWAGQVGGLLPLGPHSGWWQLWLWRQSCSQLATTSDLYHPSLRRLRQQREGAWDHADQPLPLWPQGSSVKPASLTSRTGTPGALWNGPWVLARAALPCGCPSMAHLPRGQGSAGHGQDLLSGHFPISEQGHGGYITR